LPPTATGSAVERVGIIGSGIMGAGIAEMAIVHGFEVVLSSRSRSAADRTGGRLEKSLSRHVEKGRMTDADRTTALERLCIVTDLESLADCDLVLESVVEDLAIKKSLFAELDSICRVTAVLASNTSTFPIIELAAQTTRPDKVCGLHFFNPAPVMSLVEVVRPITACDTTIEIAKAFAVECGKTAVDVQDRAGFVVNALLFPYLNSAVRLLESGTASMEDIDTAMKEGCGYPMGPFALLDLVGLDTSVAILEALYKEYGDPSYLSAPRLRRMVSAHHLGRKSGRGFYDYTPAPSPAPASDPLEPAAASRTSVELTSALR
jgi:3-hydroxybutyryl-CoA dehydrogenase